MLSVWGLIATLRRSLVGPLLSCCVKVSPDAKSVCLESVSELLSNLEKGRALNHVALYERPPRRPPGHRAARQSLDSVERSKIDTVTILLRKKSR